MFLDLSFAYVLEQAAVRRLRRVGVLRSSSHVQWSSFRFTCWVDDAHVVVLVCSEAPFVSIRVAVGACMVW